MPTKLKHGKGTGSISEYKAGNTPEHCALCGRRMRNLETRNHIVDHDHKTGMVRDVICRNCNGLEGKINNLCTRAGTWITNLDYLKKLVQYWEYHQNNTSGILYPEKKKVKKRGRLNASRR